jgi:uncharacterized protein (DUF433 family)
MIQSVITISPDIQSGSPVFTGTRVPIKNFFDYIKGGDTIDEFLEDFPSVTHLQVTTILTYAETLLTYYEENNEQNDTFGRKPAHAA